MAKITINEISRNYTYSAGNSSFCSVALPITASWGPAYEDPASAGVPLNEMLETTVFQHFNSTQEGLEAFTATYRGPAANYFLLQVMILMFAVCAQVHMLRTNIRLISALLAVQLAKANL